MVDNNYRSSLLLLFVGIRDIKMDFPTRGTWLAVRSTVISSTTTTIIGIAVKIGRSKMKATVATRTITWGYSLLWDDWAEGIPFRFVVGSLMHNKE